MPSFDIVSEVDIQEADNAVNNLNKELANRYDFKNSETDVELNKKDGNIIMISTDDMKMRTLRELLISCMLKRGIDPKSLDFSEIEKAGGNKLKRIVKLKNGISKEDAKKITIEIKNSKIKVQTSIIYEKIRVSGKKIDDLQEVIKLLKNTNQDVPLQYINMKS